MKNNLRTLHPLSWTIIIGTIFGRMATSMSIPFLAVYLTQVKGASASSAGLIIAVSSLIGIVASFYGGYVSDRIGRKRSCFYPSSAGHLSLLALRLQMPYGSSFS